MQSPEVICINRTDGIGDVILTLPMAALLKKYFPGIRIVFLGKEYTRPVVNACVHVDEFLEADEFFKSGFETVAKKPDCVIHVFPVNKIAWKAKELGIPVRIGTSGRWYHWFTCNRLVRLSRRKSDLHESQLNLKLLQPLAIKQEYSKEDIALLIGLENIEPLRPEFLALLNQNKYNVILHPRTRGSTREWNLQHFIDLINMLDPERFRIFVSGTAADKTFLQPLLKKVNDKVIDITGMMKLSQFISFIHQCDGLVANSTGPLHIAAALGKDALGIYPPMRPLHPGRWSPLGPRAKAFVINKKCNRCQKRAICDCVNAILPEQICDELNKRASRLLLFKNHER